MFKRLWQRIDSFLLAMLLTVALASLWPVRGHAASVMSLITEAAIVLLFFLHGAKLSRQAVIAGITHVRLHLIVLTVTFLVFPAIGVALCRLLAGWLRPVIATGLLYLCLLPSTVQSSIAFTSIAGGNVPAAVCSASLSNILGIVLTPLLVGLLLGSASGGVSMQAVRDIALQMLLPFVLGHLSRPLTAGFLSRHKKILSTLDRGSILLVVFSAFSAAVVSGLWEQISRTDLGLILGADALILTVALLLTRWLARVCNFSHADEIAIVFCGSKKSLASGVPMAGVLFPAQLVGPIIVPLMLFHQMQLMMCAVLARRYAGETAPP